MSAEVEPLIVIPSPREIPEITLSNAQITKYDKLWIKYYTPEIDAYQFIEKEFAENKQYTHLIILPDDLRVSPADVDLLVQDLEQYPDSIVTGYCNVDIQKNVGNANITINPVSPWRYNRTYQWINLDFFSHLNTIAKVQFAGFALFGIPRKIKQAVPFRNDGVCCIDVMFCYDVNQARYQILCDSRLRLNHLKINDNQYDNFKAGLVPREHYYEYKLQVIS